MNSRFFTALLLSFTLTVPLQAGETGHFCTMNEAQGQLIRVAGLDPDGMYRDLGGKVSKTYVDDMINIIAADQIKRKLLAGHGKDLEITWKDIYDFRGVVSAWMCNEGKRVYCVSSFIDAVGSGLFGTRIGRGLYTGGLVLAGPAGFVLMSGMEITQKTFQCNPDGVAMALDAGASLVVMLPWCKAPGAKQLCVRAQQVAGKTVLSVMGRYLGREFALGTAKILETEAGDEFVKVLVDGAKEHVTHAVSHQVHSRIMDGQKGSGAVVPEPGAPVEVAPEMGTPLGGGLYYDDPSAYIPR